nr:ribonuclease P protein component [Leyella lascolaii]
MMQADRAFTLKKEERITSRTLMERLFGGGGSRAMTSFPVRMVYLEVERDGENGPQAKVLVSVSKRHFKRAVKRNRVKRQLREAYRKNKHIVLDRMEARPDRMMAVALIWLDNNLHDTEEVESRVRSLLVRLGEKL